MRAALLRVKIRNSDSENSRSTCFDWHNFIRTCIKYEILLQILFFGLALFFKFLILTCLFKKQNRESTKGYSRFLKISASLRFMSCNFCFTSFQSTWDEGVVRRPSVVVNYSHLRTTERNLPKLDRKQLQYHRTWLPIRMLLSLSLLVFYITCNDISVICVMPQMCRRTEEECVPTVGLPTPQTFGRVL